jgi:AcrR family transcriptional regulator
MSIAALAPKRQRGHLRVELLLETAAQLFNEKGFDGVTMSEVAARSRTAIGSLYRFFPNKESLAEALIARYATTFLSGLDAIVAQSGALTAAQLVDALVDLMISNIENRATALGLVERGEDASGRKAQLRDGFRARLVATVLAQHPECDGQTADHIAATLQVILKTLPALAEKSGPSAPEIAEIRIMLVAYLARR